MHLRWLQRLSTSLTTTTRSSIMSTRCGFLRNHEAVRLIYCPCCQMDSSQQHQRRTYHVAYLYYSSSFARLKLYDIDSDYHSKYVPLLYCHCVETDYCEAYILHQNQHKSQRPICSTVLGHTSVSSLFSSCFH